MSFNTADKMQAVQQVVERLDALPPAAVPHEHLEPPAQPQFDEFYYAGGIESESTYSTQPDGPRNIPQRDSIGRSASMAQTVRKSRGYTKEEWESHSELIHYLYITEGRSLEDVRSVLQERGFEAT